MVQRISLTDLTDALHGPEREQIVRNARETLGALQERIAKDLSGGAKPAEFERQKNIAAAVSMASAVFEAYIGK